MCNIIAIYIEVFLQYYDINTTHCTEFIVFNIKTRLLRVALVPAETGRDDVAMCAEGNARHETFLCFGFLGV